MIKQIIIEEGGLISSWLAIKEKVKKLYEETKEDMIIIPPPQLVHDRFTNKTYGIYAICNKLDKHEIKRVKLFLETFIIDYKYKLLERSFPQILQYCNKNGEYNI